VKTDNQWHPAILVELTDGSFGLYDDFAEAEKLSKDKLPTNPSFKSVRCNWNYGQPKVLVDGEIISIVDTSKK
jgi:hypothetical protein